MNKNIFYVLMALLLSTGIATAQDLPRFKRIVRQLSSSKYQGRGYAHDGVRKTSRYLVREFQKSQTTKAPRFSGRCRSARMRWKS